MPGSFRSPEPPRAPALSVVVAASDSAGAVARTLAALARQRGAERLEVIVAAARDRVAAPLPGDPTSRGVRWVIAAHGTGIPRLRRLGLDRATAPVVAFTEDSCLFGPGWAEAWVAAFGDPRVRAASGTVAPAMGDAAIDWAVFFCEYAPFLSPRGGDARRVTRAGRWKWPGSPDPHPDPPPVGEGRGEGGPAPGTGGLISPSCTRLAGNNFAVRRSADADRILDRPEIHETDVAQALAGGLVRVEAAQAGHVRNYAPREAIGDRLRFGHAYGQLRARSWSPTARLAGCLAGPAILGVQVARLSAIVLGRRRHLGMFVAVLPITLGLLSAWSVGEWLGWLRAGGKSLDG